MGNILQETLMHILGYHFEIWKVYIIGNVDVAQAWLATLKLSMS